MFNKSSFNQMRKLKFLLFIFCCVLFWKELSAQALPMHRYSTSKKYPLDIITQKPSFAFSSRKLRSTYTGFAIRLRRSVDNAQADISFDASDIVSDNSVAKIAVSGTSGLAVNSTLTLASFRSGNTLSVSIWYDQSTNAYNGVQNTVARQPAYSLGVAGATNQYPSLVFTGTSKHNVTVNQTLPTLLGSGLRGSVMMLARVLAGTATNNSFGYSDISDNTKRWSAHMNWPSDNNMYTDLGNSTGESRNFLNNATIGFGKYKQYTITRSTTNKTVRVSGVMINNNVALSLQSVTWSAGTTFGVGLTTGSLDTGFNQNGFTGNIPEFILYPEALTPVQYNLIESDQLGFWGAY
jgi:hypothetical protein